jgi:hypothetical protein
MAEESVEEIFAKLNVTRILVSLVEHLGEVSIPVTKFLNTVNEDKDLQVDYNSDNQTFTFKIGSGAQSDNKENANEQ